MSTCKKGLTIKELYDMLNQFNHRDPEFFNPLFVYDQNHNSYWYIAYTDSYEDDDGKQKPLYFLKEKLDLDIKNMASKEGKMVSSLLIFQNTIIALTVMVSMKQFVDKGMGDIEIPMVFDGDEDTYFIKQACIVKKSSNVFGKIAPTFELIVDR